MRIRCECCATLYQLEDALLPPEGAPVRCTRCGSVFEARPPAAGDGLPRPGSPGIAGAAARAEAAMQREAEARAEAARRHEAEARAEAARRHEAEAAKRREAEAARQREAEAARQREAEAAKQREAAVAKQREAEAAKQREAAVAKQREAEAAKQREAAAAKQREAEAAKQREAEAARQREAAHARGARRHEAAARAKAAKGSVAPATPGPAGTAAHAATDHEAAFFAAPGAESGDAELLAFEAGMARRRRIVVGSALGVLGAVVLAVLGSLAWNAIRATSHDPAAVAKLDRLLAEVRSGDPARALAAAPLGEEALAIEPNLVRARADRGLALLVAATERKDRADRVAARRAPIERALRKAEEATDTAAAEEQRKQLETLKAEYDPLLQAYSQLKADADAAIEGAYKDGGENDPAAVRAMGLLRASSGDEKNAPVLAKNYRKLAGDEDGWADLIEGQLFASGRASPEKRAQAVEKLTAALQRDPSFGIAYLLLGRVRLDLQDFAGARKELGQALAAGPANDLARRWLTDVEAAAAPKPSPAVVPAVPAEATGAAPADPGTPAAGTAPGSAPAAPAARAGPVGTPAAAAAPAAPPTAG